MRQCVINGANIHPGANFLVKPNGQRIDLSNRTLEQRIALSKTLLSGGIDTDNDHIDKNKRNNNEQMSSSLCTVYRHLHDNDIVLMNRQPTLHKPSIMAHKCKVLNGDHKTIRMHYANCNTYNADFDDESLLLLLSSEVDAARLRPVP